MDITITNLVQHGVVKWRLVFLLYTKTHSADRPTCSQYRHRVKRVSVLLSHINILILHVHPYMFLSFVGLHGSDHSIIIPSSACFSTSPPLDLVLQQMPLQVHEVSVSFTIAFKNVFSVWKCIHCANHQTLVKYSHIVQSSVYVIGSEDARSKASITTPDATQLNKTVLLSWVASGDVIKA